MKRLLTQEEVLKFCDPDKVDMSPDDAEQVAHLLAEDLKYDARESDEARLVKYGVVDLEQFTVFKRRILAKNEMLRKLTQRFGLEIEAPNVQHTLSMLRFSELEQSGPSPSST